MKITHFIAHIEYFFHMYKVTKRCYLTTYYYDTEHTTWFTKTVITRTDISQEWAIKGGAE